MEHIIHRGEKIPLIGFGTYRLGGCDRSAEEDTIHHGISELGMTLLDTAEMYGSGLSEEILGQIIKAHERSRLFIVDKILPSNARKGAYAESCKRSLERLGTDYIDLYLLHWKDSVELQDMVYQMEELVRAGLIRHWGVSNFDTHEMQQLFDCDKGCNCFCDQILYNLSERGAEFDLIPWCKAHDVLVMAYSPLCNCCEARKSVAQQETVRKIAAAEGKTPESLMLSFVVRDKKVITVFKTASREHLTHNMQNVFGEISSQDQAKLDMSFAPPVKKYPLEKI